MIVAGLAEGKVVDRVVGVVEEVALEWLDGEGGVEDELFVDVALPVGGA